MEINNKAINKVNMLNLNSCKMKNRFCLKTVLSVVMAMLLSAGLFAQVADGDYEEYDADVATPTNIDYVTLRTGGSTTMGYYALPDPVYHPNYNAGGGWALTAGFSWNWTIPTNPGGAASVSGGGTPANYVEIDYTATGSYVVNVAEQASAAFGGCVDASPTVMNVTVIDPPSVGITTADPSQACGDQAAMTVSMSFTEAISAALAGYAFAVSEVVDNIDASDNLIGNVSTTADFVDFPTTGKLNTGNGLTGAASPYGYDFTTSALTVEGGMRTRYTYTLVKATDAPAAAADGVISAISQKSDYIAVGGGADYLTYAYSDSEIVIIVNPAPETGPIYYVPNDFNY